MAENKERFNRRKVEAGLPISFMHFRKIQDCIAGINLYSNANLNIN